MARDDEGNACRFLSRGCGWWCVGFVLNKNDVRAIAMKAFTRFGCLHLVPMKFPHTARQPPQRTGEGETTRTTG